MRLLSQTLTDLIGFAERQITQPPRRIDFSAGAGFVEVARAVRHAVALPAETIRTTQAALVMVIALEEHHAAQQDVSPWLMIAGATLPLLRREAFTALCNEREQLTEKSDGARRS